MHEIYVLARIDADGNITRFLMGAGQTASIHSVRAFDNLKTAIRSQKAFGGNVRIFKLTGLELVETEGEAK